MFLLAEASQQEQVISEVRRIKGCHVLSTSRLTQIKTTKQHQHHPHVGAYVVFLDFAKLLSGGGPSVKIVTF